MMMRMRQMLPTRAIARMMDMRVTWTIADDVIAPVEPPSMVVGAVIDGEDEEERDIVWREGCSHWVGDQVELLAMILWASLVLFMCGRTTIVERQIFPHQS